MTVAGDRISAEEKAAIVDALDAIHDALGGITEPNSIGGHECATNHERSVIERSLGVLKKHGWANKPQSTRR